MINFFRTMIDYKNEIASQNENLNIKDIALARTIGIYGLRGRPCKKSYVSVKSSKKSFSLFFLVFNIEIFSLFIIYLFPFLFKMFYYIKF